MKRILIALLCFSIPAFALELNPGDSTTLTLTAPGQAVNVTVPGYTLQVPVPVPTATGTGFTDAQTLSELVSCKTCDQVPPEKEVVPMPGNAHAVSHPAQARANGYAACQACHNPNVPNPAIVGQSGSFLCSQYDFCTSGNIAGRSQCLSGIGFTHPVTGAVIVDPVSKAPVVTGGTVGGYAPGQTPACRDCHYPHRTSNVGELRSSQVHDGCLDCHVRRGSSDRRPGIRD